MNNWFPLKAEANIFFENSRTPSHLSWYLPYFNGKAVVNNKRQNEQIYQGLK